MTIRFHCFGESGNAYKAALTLELCALAWEPVFVDFFSGETRRPEWRARVNEMGEVPVMVDGETTLTQSGAIQRYAATRAGRFGGDERREVLRWQFWDTHKLSGQAGMRRFLMSFVPEEKRPGEVIDFLGQRLEAAYEVLDAHLAHRDWIVGGARPSPILAAAATSSTTNPSASTAPAGRKSIAGLAESNRLPAGNTHMI